MLTSPSLLLLLFLSKTISFQVSVGDKPAAQKEVQLLHLAEEVKPIARKKTNRQGFVQFVVDEKKYSQVVGFSQEAGLSYFSDLIEIANASSKPYPIKTFESIAHSPELRIQRLGLSFEQRSTDLFIEQSIEVYNPSQFTISGERPEHSDKPEVFRFSLPDGTFNLMYGKGFQRDEVQIIGNDILVMSPMTPGRHFFGLQYSLEPAHFRKNLNFRFSIPVITLEISTEDPDIQPTGLRFESFGQKLYQDKTQYLYAASDLQTTELNFSLEGLNANLALSWWAPVVFFIFMILLIWVSPHLRLNTATPEAEEKQKNQALSELRKLEKLYKAGLIGSEDYTSKKLRILENLSYYYK